jgi:hypothetical protein
MQFLSLSKRFTTYLYHEQYENDCLAFPIVICISFLMGLELELELDVSVPTSIT